MATKKNNTKKAASRKKATKKKTSAKASRSCVGFPGPETERAGQIDHPGASFATASMRSAFFPVKFSHRWTMTSQ